MSHLAGLNCGPLRYECNALPTELRWRTHKSACTHHTKKAGTCEELCLQLKSLLSHLAGLKTATAFHVCALFLRYLVSHLPGLNWRPHPYHGCALPSELRWRPVILPFFDKPANCDNQLERHRGSRTRSRQQAWREEQDHGKHDKYSEYNPNPFHDSLGPLMKHK